METELESLGCLFGPQGVSGRQAYPMESTHKPEGNSRFGGALSAMGHEAVVRVVRKQSGLVRKPCTSHFFLSLCVAVPNLPNWFGLFLDLFPC